MVNRTPSQIKQSPINYYSSAEYDVQVSQNDIVTLGDFLSTEKLCKAVLMRKDNGQELTCTTALNVITVTEADVNINCRLWVFGVGSN